ncbi:MAG: saccharopine dehydrogenase NADP-binding domain-containing protein [Caldilineaceae bacterium]|nr:saccharopine dehydrogenase NADP-binding domain-containing protein [Caldilineaceae bacterium]
MTEPRPFDIVLYGATGFTGRLTAEYLAQQGGFPFRWAMAGRSLDKLRQIRTEIGVGEEVTLIRADSDDPASLVAMAGQTRVVLTTVGPYIRYGEPLVKAAIEAGADYADITGEPEFVNTILDRYDAPARERGVRIVNCCGFDSVPHDLGVYMVVKELPDDAAVTVEGFISTDASFSGGTWHSAIEMISRRGLRGPKVKSPAGDGRVVASGKRTIHRSDVTGGWVAPLPTIDPQVILRSARALPIYGQEFRYVHYLDVGSLPKLIGLGIGVGALAGMAQIKPTRDLLYKLQPQGQGPSAEKRARSHFQVTIIGRAGDQKVVGKVNGGDPGYTETAKMAAESALCLALDRDRLPDRAGVLTPVVTMGDPLLERLRAAGMIFEIVVE